MSSKTVFECDECKIEINEYHRYKSLGRVWPSVYCQPSYHGPALCFFPWNESDAKAEGNLHFCSDVHAERYLVHWLDEQRTKQEAAVSPAPDASDPQFAVSKYVEPLPPFDVPDGLGVIDGQYPEVADDEAIPI